MQIFVDGPLRLPAICLDVKLGRAMNLHDDNEDIKVMHMTIGNGTYFYILALHCFSP
jgi:hypothetical protein